MYHESSPTQPKLKGNVAWKKKKQDFTSTAVPQNKTISGIDIGGVLSASPPFIRRLPPDLWRNFSCFLLAARNCFSFWICAALLHSHLEQDASLCSGLRRSMTYTRRKSQRDRRTRLRRKCTRTKSQRVPGCPSTKKKTVPHQTRLQQHLTVGIELETSSAPWVAGSKPALAEGKSAPNHEQTKWAPRPTPTPSSLKRLLPRLVPRLPNRDLLN